MKLRRRTVSLPQGAPKRGRLFAFGYPELAKLLGLSEAAVRKRVSRGRLDPSDLETICREWATRPPPKE